MKIGPEKSLLKNVVGLQMKVYTKLPSTKPEVSIRRLRVVSSLSSPLQQTHARLLKVSPYIGLIRVGLKKKPLTITLLNARNLVSRPKGSTETPLTTAGSSTRAVTSRSLSGRQHASSRSADEGGSSLVKSSHEGQTNQSHGRDWGMTYLDYSFKLSR